MNIVKLKAIRPLSGEYGSVHPGWTFATDERTAESLEARGLAERYRPPAPRPAPPVFPSAPPLPPPEPEVKAVEPSENKMLDVPEVKVTVHRERRQWSRRK